MSTVTQATTYYNLIDGEWVPAVSGDLFENRNPANTDDLIGVFQKSSAADAQRAIEAARRAYEHWRLVPAPKRAELLFRVAQLLAERKESLARDMTREMGKVLDETRGDVQEAIDMTYFMAGEGRRQYGIFRWPSPRGRSSRRWSAATRWCSSRRR
jgi:acyl-CoA reductase-like NAD-dependent aldehyde dehydrogenase